MAVDPATQFNRPGISAGTTYVPVKTELGTPNMGSPGAGQLWAQVGQTAMKAGEMLQNSPLLNPMVRAQMQEQMARAQAGTDMLNYYKNLPPEEQYKRFMLGRETAQGYEQISPAESGAKVFPYFQPKLKSKEAPPAPPAPSTAPGTGKEATEDTGKKPEEKKTEEKAAPGEIDPNSLPDDTAATGTTRPYYSASTDQGPIPTTSTTEGVERQPAAAYRAEYAAQRPQGAPQGTFLNPATGSYEPLQQAPPAPSQAAQQPQQPAQQPVHPIAHLKGVNDQAEQQAQQQASQQALQTWQNANTHPADSGSALAWAKNFHTGYKTATFLANGGPGGEPAYNFSDGRGLNNVVPLSQMIKNGFAPSMVAGNTSPVLSVLEQNRRQTQGPQGPGLPMGPVAPPQQPQPAQPQVAQQGPPSAPSVWNPQQPTPGPPVAPAAPGQEAISPPNVASPPTRNVREVTVDEGQPYGGGNLMAEAGEKAGTRTDIAAQPVAPAKAERIPLTDNDKSVFTDQAIADARAKAANTQPDPNRKDESGNPYMFDLGPYHIYRDDTGRTGELYAIRPGRTSLFRQQQYRLGSDGWDEYDLPDTNARMQAEALFGGGKGAINGSPIPASAGFPPGSTFPTMKHDQIVDLPIGKLTRLLSLAGQYLNTTSQPNQPEAQRMDNLIAASQYLQRMADGAEIAEKDKISPTFYSSTAQYESHQARKRDEVVPPGGWHGLLQDPFKWTSEIPNTQWWNYHNWRAEGSERNKFSDYMEYQARGLNDAITQLQATGRVPYLQRPEEGTSASVYAGPVGGSLKMGSDPYATTRSPHIEVSNLFSGGEPAADSRSNLLALKGAYDKQFKQEYEQAVGAGWRPTAQAIDTYYRLTHGASVKDTQDESGRGGNQFRNSAGQLVNPYPIKGAQGSSTPGPTPGPTTAPTPIPHLPIMASKDQMKLFRKQHPNEDFQYKDEHGVWHRQTAAPLGD